MGLTDMTEKIINTICAEYGVSVEDLTGKCRQRNFADARQMAMYLLWDVTGMPITHICRLLNRDHATVYMAISKAKSLLIYDKEVKQHYRNIHRKLNDSHTCKRYFNGQCHHDDITDKCAGMAGCRIYQSRHKFSIFGKVCATVRHGVHKMHLNAIIPTKK